MVTDQRVRGVSCHERYPLGGDWHVARTEAGAAIEPDHLHALPLDWRDASVPETVAAVLHNAGEWDWTRPENLDAADWWYRCRFPVTQTAATTHSMLRLCGLATIADVWLNGVHLLHSENMFVEYAVDISEHLRDHNELFILCAALSSTLTARRPRGRWRTRLVEQQQLRWMRTTLLGRMPGWSASPQPVGLWRPVVLEHQEQVQVVSADVQTQMRGTTGHVDVTLTVQPIGQCDMRRAVCRVGDVQATMTHERHGDLVTIRGHIQLPGVDLWWPHTHGAQPLYAVTVLLDVGGGADSASIDLGRVGFRSITLDTAQDNFAVRVNGVPIFCRGACWSPVDVVRLTGSAAEYREALTLAREAGMNMIRVGGTMIYEADAFYDLCDELGILVWQDFMFSNMDYPVSDNRFSATVTEEVTQFLHRMQGRPCIALLCGNNEIEQQAAMLGLSRELWTNAFFQETLPAQCRVLCPDVPYWPSSPSGGVFPFHVNAGDAHYFGYGPYLRPFDDVRTSRVRFASESLAFANVPEASTIALIPGGARGAGHHPAWKAAVPRDNGSGWDFEDVRDHYVEQLFAIRPTQLRYADPERYLAFGRVASGEVMARAIGAWRRRTSECHGALIWFYRDLRPGAGWGVIDSTGTPKAAYYYMRRACQPIAVILSDDGLNGVRVDAVNDTAAPLDAQLRVTLYRNGALQVATGTMDFTIPPRGAVDVAVEEVLEERRFIDSSYAYRFGAPNHDVIVAALTERTTGVILGDAYHFPLGFPAVLHAVSVPEAVAVPLHDGTYRVEIHSSTLAVAVSLDAEGFRPDDNYFHVEPGRRRTIMLRPIGSGKAGQLTGVVTPLNAHTSTRIVVQ